MDFTPAWAGLSGGRSSLPAFRLSAPSLGLFTDLPPHPVTVITSLLLGAALGGANALVAAWTAYRATGTGEPLTSRSLNLILGGMVGRMFFVLACAGIVLAFVPVQRGAFVAGLGLLFFAGMLAEVFLVLGRTPARTPSDA